MSQHSDKELRELYRGTLKACPECGNATILFSGTPDACFDCSCEDKFWRRWWNGMGEQMQRALEEAERAEGLCPTNQARSPKASGHKATQ